MAQCKICGYSTSMEATKLCNGCYEVVSRIDYFLSLHKGRELIAEALRNREIKCLAVIEQARNVISGLSGVPGFNSFRTTQEVRTCAANLNDLLK
jgi:hypothetical protein